MGFATLLKRLLFPTTDEKPEPKKSKPKPPAPQASLF
jgi:hypothetical protein